MCRYTDRIRSILVRSLGIRHTLPYGALIRLLLHMVLFDTFEFFFTFLCTCPFLYGSWFHCYEHPPRWYGPVHELINFDFSFFFLVWCWSEYAILYVTFIWSFVLLMFNFMSVLLFLYISLFFVNYQILFIYLSVVLCSQSCHLFD